MGGLEAGKSVLIHAAAGGTGLLAVQMAKMVGALVLGTTSSPEKAQLVRQMGADHLIIYTQEDVPERVRQLTGGRGVDLVLDSVGKATFEGSLKALAPFGHLIVYGMASGRIEPFDIRRLFENSQKISAFWLVTAMRMPDLMRRGVEQVLDWIATGKLKITIGLKLPLSQVAEAHRRMEARQTAGKIILTT
jgi:NADPH2:quinone reductase